MGVNGQYSLGISFAYEYNFTDKGTSVSVDLALGWSF